MASYLSVMITFRGDGYNFFYSYRKNVFLFNVRIYANSKVMEYLLKPPNFSFEATASLSFSSLTLLFCCSMDDESYRQNVNIMTDKR